MKYDPALVEIGGGWLVMDIARRQRRRRLERVMVGLAVALCWVMLSLPAAAAQDVTNPPTAKKSKDSSTARNGERERRVGTARPVPIAKTPGAGASGSDSYPVPDWVYDARWYYIDVPRFHNGDRSNDPRRTEPWTALWPVRDDPAFTTISSDTAAAQELTPASFGGDIKGVIGRFGYMKALGINAIVLGGLFDEGWESRNDPQRILRIREHNLRSPERAFGSDSNPSEMAFSELIEAAHTQGIRVALEYPFANDTFWAFPNVDDAPIRPKGLMRWFDLDGDGDHTDAIDAVWISNPVDLFDHSDRGNVFRRKMAAVNPDCVVIGPCRGCVKWNAPPPFGFIFPAYNSKSGGSFRWMTSEPDSSERSPRINSCQPASTTELMFSANYVARVRPDAVRLARDRLALILHHLATSSPVMLYGDEVGIMRGTGEWRSPPMWWNDLPDPKTKSPDYRGDFFALVQWLHMMRAEHKPLRRGGFRLVLDDAENKIFAFARTLPGDEVILVMNYGDTKQKVMLPAGTPGQMVVAMTPMIDPSKSRLAKLTKGKYDHTKIAPLPVGGGRAFVNKEGKVRLWVAPMSIRVVLVNDEEPRRQ